LKEIAIVIADRAPIVQRRGFGFSKRGGDHLEWMILNNVDNHLLEAFDFECGMMLVHSGHFVTQRGGEIFFVADHHVHVWGDAAIYFLRLFFSAMRLPE